MLKKSCYRQHHRHLVFTIVINSIGIITSIIPKNVLLLHDQPLEHLV